MRRIAAITLGAAVAGGVMVVSAPATSASQRDADSPRPSATVRYLEAGLPGTYEGSSPGNHLTIEISAPRRFDTGRATDFDLFAEGTVNGRSWSRGNSVLRITNTGSGYTLSYLPTIDVQAGYVPGGGRDLCEAPLSAQGSTLSSRVDVSGGCRGAFPNVNGTWTVSFTPRELRITSANGKRVLAFRKTG